MLVRTEAACLFHSAPFSWPSYSIRWLVWGMHKEIVPQWRHAPSSNMLTPIRVHV